LTDNKKTKPEYQEEVVRGERIVKTDKWGKIRLLGKNLAMQLKAEVVYNQAFSNYLKAGLSTKEELIEEYKKRGLWSDEDETRRSELAQSLESYAKEYFAKQARLEKAVSAKAKARLKQDIKELEQAIKEIQQDLSNLMQKYHRLIQYSADNLALADMQLSYVVMAVRKEDGSSLFVDKEPLDMSPVELLETIEDVKKAWSAEDYLYLHWKLQEFWLGIVEDELPPFLRDWKTLWLT